MWMVGHVDVWPYRLVVLGGHVDVWPYRLVVMGGHVDVWPYRLASSASRLSACADINKLLCN